MVGQSSPRIEAFDGVAEKVGNLFSPDQPRRHMATFARLQEAAREGAAKVGRLEPLGEAGPMDESHELLGDIFDTLPVVRATCADKQMSSDRGKLAPSPNVPTSMFKPWSRQDAQAFL